MSSRVSQHGTIAVSDEALPPRVKAALASWVFLIACALDGRQVAPIGDGVTPLHHLPGVVVGRACALLLPRRIADRRRTKAEFSALHGRQPGRCRYL